MPGDVVRDRREVVHPVRDRDVLVEIVLLAELLKPRVQVPNVGHGPDDPLAVELEDDPQRRVRRRVLRAKVHDPAVAVVLELVDVGRGLDVDVERLQFVRHSGAAPRPGTGPVRRPAADS
jgi:hypothetical protein